MRKQTGYSFRTYRTSAVDPSARRQVMEASIKEEYLDNGWEVLRAEIARVDVNDIYVAVHLVKYEEVPEVVAKK